MGFGHLRQLARIEGVRTRYLTFPLQPFHPSEPKT